MTNWIPDLNTGDGPLYLRLADAIEAAIEAGELAAGQRLPAQRNLAFDIGVTLGTVSRAYTLVHERGLVSGEVGRGTFVLGKPSAAERMEPAAIRSMHGTRLVEAPAGKMKFDATGAPDVGQAAAIRAAIAATVDDHPVEIANYSRSFPAHWQEAGARWIARAGWSPRSEDVVSTQGVHAAIVSIVAAFTVPGDRILFESLTYTHVARALGLMGRRIVSGEIDEEGLIPDEFERICQQQHPAIAFLMPSGHNPTLAVMSEPRRKAIAEIARRHNVLLIEDDIYGVLIRQEAPMLAAFAPERTFVVSGLSKAVTAGLRGGWAACPPHMAARVKVAHKMLTGGTAFLLAEATARLVLSGEAERIRTDVIAELAAREQIARETLAGQSFRSSPRLPFLWLSLPEPWLSGTFKAAAFDAGVLVDDEDEFKAGRAEKMHHKVRFAFTSHQREDVRRGFLTLRRLLESGLTAYDSAI